MDLRALWARIRRWFRPPRQLQFTREGKYFVGITLGVGFAAINTGNNLLYLLLGMMLSLIMASAVMSESSLRDLDVTRQPPAALYAQRPFLMGIGLKNDKKKLPSFSTSPVTTIPVVTFWIVTNDAGSKTPAGAVTVAMPWESGKLTFTWLASNVATASSSVVKAVETGRRAFPVTSVMAEVSSIS